MNSVKPKPLNKGDIIRVIASSSPFEKDAFFEGIQILKELGFSPVYSENIFDKIPYLAGSDERRAQELIHALEDPEAKAILFARGGYGAMRLLPHLDKKLKNPKIKILLGYSDITCLLNYMQQRHQWNVFYGPVIAKDLCKSTHPETITSLQNNLTGFQIPHIITHENLVSINDGCVTASLTGGCLSLINSLLGTPYEIDTTGKILFLEDTNERPYEVDRMLTHLKLAGKFETCKGLVFGSLSGPNPREHYEETIRSNTQEFGFPVLFNLNVGHASPKLTVPLGLSVELNATKKQLTLLESPHA